MRQQDFWIDGNFKRTELPIHKGDLLALFAMT